MVRPQFRNLGYRILGNGNTWMGLGAGFFLSSAWLMERHGVQTFDYVGGRFSSGPQTGTPGMLFAAGWGIVALMALRLLRRQMAVVKAYRAKSGDKLLPND